MLILILKNNSVKNKEQKKWNIIKVTAMTNRKNFRAWMRKQKKVFKVSAMPLTPKVNMISQISDIAHLDH